LPDVIGAAPRTFAPSGKNPRAAIAPLCSDFCPSPLLCSEPYLLNTGGKTRKPRCRQLPL